MDTVVEHGGIPMRLAKAGDASGKQPGETIKDGEKKETKVIDGKKYLFEPAIKGDVAILRAWKVDKAGNCRFRRVQVFISGDKGGGRGGHGADHDDGSISAKTDRYTTRAFAPLMAKAAKLSIVEVGPPFPLSSSVEAGN